jgi:small neutral amino acid transporter SnatA (MarC family)
VSLALLAFAAVCVVNPARVRPTLAQREPVVLGALGAALTWATLVPVVALADTVLDALQVADTTLRMAAAVVLVLQGTWALLTPLPGAEPALPGRRAALVPVAFPVLLTPGLALLALSGALDRSAPVAWALLGAVLVLVPAVGRVRTSPLRLKVLDGLGRLTGGLLIAAGVALLMNGLYDL